MDKKTETELRRQGLHAVFGVGVASIIFLLPKAYASAALGIGLILGLCLSSYYKKTRQRFLHSVLVLFERRKDLRRFPGKGPVMLLSGALVVCLLLPRSVAVPAVLVVSLSDAAATAAGVVLGKHRHVHNPDKSIEGSLAFFVVSCIITYVFAPALITMFVCFIITLVETAGTGSRRTALLDDNFVVPVVYGLLLYLMLL